jgi:hypothetical protein
MYLRVVVAVVVAVSLIFHGLIGLLGFVAYLRLATFETLPYSAVQGSGGVEVYEAGGRIYGLLWGLVAVGSWWRV